MKKQKRFDCVALKNQNQDKLRTERETLGEKEVLRRHRHWLCTSDDPLAKWCRKATRTRKIKPVTDRSCQDAPRMRRALRRGDRALSIRHHRVPAGAKSLAFWSLTPLAPAQGSVKH